MMVPPGGRSDDGWFVAKSIRVVQSPLSGFSGCTTTGGTVPASLGLLYVGSRSGGKPGSPAAALIKGVLP